MKINETPLSDVERHHAERYSRAAHAVQTGVLMAIQTGLEPIGDEGERNIRAHKHLRTGVNSALVDSAAIGRLLVEKGIITREEYLRAVADAMEDEVRRYEKMLEERLNQKVILG